MAWNGDLAFTPREIARAGTPREVGAGFHAALDREGCPREGRDLLMSGTLGKDHVIHLRLTGPAREWAGGPGFIWYSRGAPDALARPGRLAMPSERPATRAGQFLAAKRLLRAHPDWTDEQVAADMGLHPLEVPDVIPVARRDLAADQDQGGSIRSQGGVRPWDLT